MSKITNHTKSLFYQFYKLVNKWYAAPAKGVTLDIVIPLIERDLSVLPLCLEGIASCVNHNVDTIYVVSPPSPNIEAFCKEHNLTYVDENTILGYTPQDIDFVTNDGEDRRGWIFQQFIKLSGVLGKNRYFLVIDANHILINPHTFLTDTDKFVFYKGSECHVPYCDNVEALMGVNYGFFTFSYVARKMIFDKNLLLELRSKLEHDSGLRWDKAIIDSLDRNEISPFSEFELYGNFVPRKRKISLPWRNLDLLYSDIDSYDTLVSKYVGHYLAITFNKE